MEEVGRENIFIFGLTADQVTSLRNGGYNPQTYYDSDAELRLALDSISPWGFSHRKIPIFFHPLWNRCCTGEISICSWPTTGLT